MYFLLYSQVVTLATYSFFITSVMGRQWLYITEGPLKNHHNPIDQYFPVFTTLQVMTVFSKQTVIFILMCGLVHVEEKCSLKNN